MAEIQIDTKELGVKLCYTKNLVIKVIFSVIYCVQNYAYNLTSNDIQFHIFYYRQYKWNLHCNQQVNSNLAIEKRCI